MSVFPLTEKTREQLVLQLQSEIGNRDPLPFLQKHVFRYYPNFGAKVLPAQGLSSWTYYQALIRNFELSAWAARPPLLVALLRALPQLPQSQAAITQILEEGPFQCHPQNSPYWVCRVATELPLVGRDYTRAAAKAFDLVAADGSEGKRVLRVFGPSGSGKTHTLSFFKYLENVQPTMLGVVDIDFADRELAMQAAGADIPIELLLARRMETQVRRRLAELQATDEATGDFPDLTAIAEATAAPHSFKPLSGLQQRNHWARELADDLVDQVIYRLVPVPTWWVLVLDNCEKAPAEAHEFVRRLVERGAGVSTDQASIGAANIGQFRVVLLGESNALMPANLYRRHILDEDLNNQSLGEKEVQRYFITFRECRGIDLDATRIRTLTSESIDLATEIMSKPAPTGTDTPVSPPPPWPRALATAIIQKTLPLDALAFQKGGENP